jgi:hypothetical protein
VTVIGLPLSDTGNLALVAGWPDTLELETSTSIPAAASNITAFLADPARPLPNDAPRSTIKLRMGLSGTIQQIQATNISRVDAGRFGGVALLFAGLDVPLIRTLL